MEITCIKQHGWNGGLLMVGRKYNLPNDQAKMLIRDRVAVSDEWPPKKKSIECAAEEPRDEMAVEGRPKPRRRRRSANSRTNA